LRRGRFNDVLEPLWFSDAEIAADLPREMVIDLGVARDRASLSRTWVVPPRMAPSLA